MRRLFKFLLATLVIFFIGLGGYVYFNYTTPILMYHSLDSTRINTYAAVEPVVFYKQMEFIKKHGFRTISLDEYCQLLKEGKTPPRNTVIITFDDGYKDNLGAIEILKNFDYPATIFVVVDKLGTENFLSVEDVAWFLKNTKVNLGSHTVTERYLPHLSSLALGEEILNSKHMLQNMFSVSVNTIAYPTGGFDERILREVKSADYLCACTTNRGFAKSLDRFALRRIKVTNRDLGVKFWIKLSGYYDVFRRVKKPY